MTKLNYFRKNISEIEPLDKLLHELTIACNKLKSEKIEYSRVNDMFHASNELEKNKINLEKEDDKLMNYDTLNTNGRKLNKKEGKPMVNCDANDNINLTMKIDKTTTETINFLNQLREQLLEDRGNLTLTKQAIFDEALDVINNRLRQLFIKPVINRSPNLTSFSIRRDPLIDKRQLEDEDAIEKLHKDIASLSEQEIDDNEDIGKALDKCNTLSDYELFDDEDNDLFDDEYEDETTIVYNNCKVINIQPYEINTTIFNNCTVINIDDIDFSDNDSLTNLLKLIEGTDAVG